MDRTFRLRGLLRLRRLQEDQAAAELARANGRRAESAARRDRAAESLSGHAFAGESDLPTWRATLAARSALRQDLVASTAMAEAAAQTAAEREAEWSARRAESRTLEKLAERHDERVAVEDLRVEQAQLDEAATRAAAAQDGEDRPDDGSAARADERPDGVTRPSEPEERR